MQERTSLARRGAALRSGFSLACAALLALVAIGCGGGGSGGGSAATAGGSGQVAVLLRDAPIDDYTSINLTVHEILMRPVDNSAPVILFSSGSGEVIDLLALADHDMVLSVVDAVPAGTYERIELVVSDVTTEGGPCDTLDVVVPSGRIKLKPREPFTVTADALLTIRLDVDVNKSLHLHPAGASGMCIFRPVVHVDVVSGVPDDRCHRNLFGEVTALETDNTGALVGFELDLGATRGVVAIDLSDTTVSFGLDGLPTSDSIVEIGALLTVHGRLGADGDFDAAALIAGEALELDGVVQSPGVGGFEFDLEPGGGIVGPIDVATFAETAIFLECDPANGDVVVDSAEATVTGKLVLTDSELRAAVVVVAPPSVAGAVISITEVIDGYEFVVQPSDPTLAVATIFVPDTLEIAVAGAGPFDPVLLLDLVGCANRPVEINLDPTDPSVAIAVAFPGDTFDGTVESIDAAAGEWMVDGQLVSVDNVSQVIDLRGVQTVVTLDAVEVGDTVELFGLDGCPTDPAAFHATVVTIVGPEGADLSEGCGHGYWKQPHHFDSWPADYAPDMLFSDVFEDAFPGMTLLAVLQQGGGGLNSLGRALVAALLNAASPGVDYEYAPDQVIAMFNDVFPDGDYQGLKSDLNSANEAGCPLD